MATTDGFLSVEEVARRLKVKRETIYAYVSRGLLRRRGSGSERDSYFDPIEVERFAGRSRKAPRNEGPAPMFKSAITTIVTGEPYYRGRPVCALARSASFEQVTGLIWRGELDDGEDNRFVPDAGMTQALRRVSAELPTGILPFERLQVFIPVAAAVDPMRHDLNALSILSMTRRLMATLVEAMPPALKVGRRAGASDKQMVSLTERLWSRLCPRPASPGLLRALNAILVLAADHDLRSFSTIAARLAAAAESDIYSVIAAGMHASGGIVQSASSLVIESYLDALNNPSSVGQMIGDHLRRGQETPGFGHPRYPEGDPRATLILELLREADVGSVRMRKLDELLDLQRKRGLPPPNIGFAIAALVHLAGMIRGAGDVIFGFARMSGWVGHALEQYRAGELPRQQSVYVGPSPVRPKGSRQN